MTDENVNSQTGGGASESSATSVPDPDTTPNDATPTPTPATSGGKSTLLTVIQYALFSILGIAFLVLMATALTGSNTVLSKIRDNETARGLITFLIAVTTVAIAVILVLASIISSGPNLKERFEQGREIFTTLIGILGTIVGFYFGSSQTPQTQPGPTPTPTPTPAAQTRTNYSTPTLVSNPQPARGETINISSYVNTGTPPYTYSIAFEPNVIPPVRDATSQDGFIRQDVPIPIDVAAGTPVRFRIDANDSQGRTISYNEDPALQFQIK